MAQPDTAQVAAMIEGGRHLVPAHMWGAVERYYLHGIEPGSFLAAVLSNDLFDAFGRADDENAARMQDLVRFFYNYTPRGSYGSRELYRAWLAQFERVAA